MSNSPLVNYTQISPNRNSPRNHKIDTITIHCVVGQASVESLGNLFANPDRQACSNYGVGYDGRIGLYCPEGDRSWCSSSPSNDHRAITIEVASDNYYPYAVNSAAYDALINLVADICKRNGIKKLLWQNNPNLIGQVEKQNMTVHRWFAQTECPGDYLMERMGDIAKKVNEIIGGDTPVPVPTGTQFTYQVFDDINKVWLPNVVNDSDYAGIYGSDVDNVYIDCNAGDVEYCVHTWAGDEFEHYAAGGQWLPWVKNREDYAGLSIPIDAIAIKSDKPCEYQVHLRKMGGWLENVSSEHCDLNDPEYGYAGIIGQPIDAIIIRPF